MSAAENSPDGVASLLPCPFCGGEARLNEGEWGKNATIEVECVSCDFTLPTIDEYHLADAIRKATEVWNRRAPLAAATIKPKHIGVHIAHCFTGEYENSCKYGDYGDCPAAPSKENSR